jgi:glycosyltransferase involved in cell wall biosynthesis
MLKRMIGSDRLRKKLGKNAWQDIREHYTWDRNASNIVNEFEKLLGCEVLTQEA